MAADHCVCVGGTQAFRANAEVLAPREPREDEDAWRRRVSHGVLSPFLTRLAEQAAGLLLRKPITLESKEEDGEVDPYWEDLFIKDVDGYGTDLDSFARRLVLNSFLYGHSACLVDYPSREAPESLLAEREMGLRPYFIPVEAQNILGWRKGEDSPIAPLEQIRINEYVTEPLGLFGEKVVRQIRVLERGKWSVWRKGENGWQVHDQGTTSIPVIPLAVTYSGKVTELVSKPPLLPIAHLNLLHAQRQMDLQHALHVSALPLLTLQGFDDVDEPLALSANSAILLPVEGDAKYVEPASSSFDAQQGFISELENQMRSLGISTLFSQTFVGETAESKQLSRTDSDSLLAVVSKDLEEAIQNAMDMAAAYVGKEAPQVRVNRDFDLQTLEPQQVAQYMGLWTQGVITLETLLEMLKEGEILPHLDIEREVEMLEQQKLNQLDLEAAGGTEPQEEQSKGSSDEERGDSEAMQEAKRRLVNEAKKLKEDKEATKK